MEVPSDDIYDMHAYIEELQFRMETVCAAGASTRDSTVAGADARASMR